MAKRSLDESQVRSLLDQLAPAQAAFAAAYPGESERRQPVHTVYGGAQIFKANTAQRLGELALRSLQEHAPDAKSLAKVLEWRSAELSQRIYDRVLDKLNREPVEDFRIDFEDGYGHRSDAEEDGHAESTAREVSAGLEAGSLPPFLGIRIKPLTPELQNRSLRTLDIFVTTLLEEAGRLPDNFVITLPKVVAAEQVDVLVQVLAMLEDKLHLEPGALPLEIMVETTQSIFSPEGAVALRPLVDAANGRCRGAHFGTYDYTAGCGITAAHQHMLHPACDFAKNVMQVALGGTGVWLSDGATNVMPVGPHRGPDLDEAELEENERVVHEAMRLHYHHARHSLETGYYQGWDLHPAQLPTRYAAVYSFFLESLEAATARLRNFIEQAAQATLVGDVFDDAATGQGLLNYFLRGLNCGAVTLDEVLQTGLTEAELRTRSFVKILESRRANS